MLPILLVRATFRSYNRQDGKQERPPQGGRFNGIPEVAELNSLPKAAVSQRKVPPGTNILARNSPITASSIDHQPERTEDRPGHLRDLRFCLGGGEPATGLLKKSYDLSSFSLSYFSRGNKPCRSRSLLDFEGNSGHLHARGVLCCRRVESFWSRVLAVIGIRTRLTSASRTRRDRAPGAGPASAKPMLTCMNGG